MPPHLSPPYSHFCAADVFVVPFLWFLCIHHTTAIYIYFCPDYLKTYPLSHISTTIIIIRSHQPESLSPTSLYLISSIHIVIFHHLTTSTPSPQSYLISAAAAAAILLNHHPMTTPPSSFSRISTTSVFIVMRTQNPLHYTMTLINLIWHFLVGQIFSRDTRLATSTLTTAATEAV